MYGALSTRRSSDGNRKPDVHGNNARSESVTQIFVDMDGVIADFDAHYKALFALASGWITQTGR